MSQVRLFIDEDAAERVVVDALRNKGIDILTVFEAGMDRQDDHEQLLYAANDGRVLYTLNV
jgi:predicted nuclease of predicted toxin-antitoxin system